jgi:Protein of unknown function (DUF3619)
MNEAQFAHRVRHELNVALDLEPLVASRLRAAREAALERCPAAGRGTATVAGGVLGRLGAPLAFRVLAPVLLVALACSAIFTWQQNQRAAELEELDAQLLSSDLPIDAYLDPGFVAWLKRRGS